MLNILVVDDSLIIRRNIGKMISELGHKVVAEAKSGKEAVSAYETTNPDIVTMDITMPDMDGIEAVKIIKDKFTDAKIVMVTSHGQEDMVIKAVQAGASGYVLKPITKEKIVEAIGKVYPELVEEKSSKKVYYNIDDEII